MVDKTIFGFFFEIITSSEFLLPTLIVYVCSFIGSYFIFKKALIPYRQKVDMSDVATVVMPIINTILCMIFIIAFIVELIYDIMSRSIDKIKLDAERTDIPNLFFRTNIKNDNQEKKQK